MKGSFKMEIFSFALRSQSHEKKQFVRHNFKHSLTQFWLHFYKFQQIKIKKKNLLIVVKYVYSTRQKLYVNNAIYRID